jgi:prepilin-type N-terminal cleavage/methylation domain-containing protein
MIDSNRGLSPRSGFTLVELMMSILIIAILASAILFAMASAQEKARADKTKTIIATLNSLLVEHYDTYRYRRAPIQILSTDSPATAARKRLAAIRELMQLEMPDRWSEVRQTPAVLLSSPALQRAYQRIDTANGTPTTNQNQGAECLYMIITLATGDGEARGMFREEDIGDTDNDGHKEFLDGWGQPIAFLRWPAGFLPSEKQTGDATKDHDPFDPRLVDPDAYRLVPLIYSGGPDKETDIVSTNYAGDFAYPASGSPALLDPYAEVESPWRMGTPSDNENSGAGDGIDEWIDNIHNHLIGTN